MRALIFPLTLLTAFSIGFQIAKTPQIITPLAYQELKAFEEKKLTIILYAYNQSPWVEKTLRSVFEQDYENYQVIFIDDGSTDNTFQTAQSFIHETNQTGRAFLFQNEERHGYLSSLQEVLQGLGSNEIVLPLSAKDWLSSDLTLKKVNAAFQEKGISIVKAKSIEFPAYIESSTELEAFYIGAVKNETLLLKGKKANLQEICLILNHSSPD